MAGRRYCRQPGRPPPRRGPELLVPRLRAAYLLAAVTLEVDGQTEAAREYRQRVGQLDACHD
ncbi:hypothetical protein ACFV8Z_24820 [Streptomyces sp. NPDC059837]|uniref:hypothetical protein n=1 Tax=Streptomyces sp. NPDC059837 TaxID=3346968 RepID=UPI003650B607